MQKSVFLVILRMKGGPTDGTGYSTDQQCGIPIACCIILFMQQNKLTNTLHDISSTMSVMSARLDDIENSLRKGGVKSDSKD